MSTLRDRRRELARRRRRMAAGIGLFTGLWVVAWAGTFAAVYAAYRLLWFIVSGFYAVFA